MAASSTLLPRVTIQAIPDQVDLEDLHVNGKLLSDEQIQKLIEKKRKIHVGRNKARDLNAKIDLNTRYDVSYFKGEYFAIYKGKQKALGKGEYGKVKLAQNLVTGEWVALKVVTKAGFEWIRREVTILRIVKQYIFGDVRMNKYLRQQHEIFMKLAPGVSLDKLIEENNEFDMNELSVVEYVEIMITLLELCDKLLDESIVHRDIKGANIMIAVAKHVLTLVDYGFATKMNQSGSYQSVPGTGSSRYQAPEIRDDDKKRMNEKVLYNERTEMYALTFTFAKLLGMPFNPGLNGFYCLAPGDMPMFEAKIPQPSTQAKIITQLNSMIQFDPAKRPTMKSCVTHFKAVRDGLDVESRIIIVGCIDLQDYLNAKLTKQDEILNWLRASNRICLVDRDEAYKHRYVEMKRYFELGGFIVLDEVVQYKSREVDMPLALAAYLKCLPHADTRHYAGLYLLTAAQKENARLKGELNRNGLMYATTEYQRFGSNVTKYAFTVMKPQLTTTCSEMLEAERDRLKIKNEKKSSTKREQRIAALTETTGVIHDMMTSGLVRWGVFENSLERLEKTVRVDKKTKTYKLVSEVNNLFVMKMIEYKFSQPLLPIKPLS